MSGRFAYLLLGWLLIAAFVSESGRAERPRLKKPSEHKFEAQEISNSIGFRVTGAKLMGQAANEISDRDGGFYEMLLFGVGLTVDHTVSPHLAVALNLDYDWKTPPTEWVGVINCISAAAGVGYRFSPRSRSSLRVSSELGITSFNSGGHGLGSHAHLRVGLGEQRVSGPTTFFRYEFYYKYVFTKGYDISKVPLLPWDEAPFDVAWIGLELTFALGL